MSLDSKELQIFLRSRRSIRHFRPDPVPREVIERILETGTRAPSAHNRQPWRFAVLTSPEARARLADAMGADFRRDLLAGGLSPEDADKRVQRSRDRIRQAPIAIILCLTVAGADTCPDRVHPERSRRKRQRFEFQMAVQSVALAGGQILLAAHAEGLGGVWMCAPLFAQETVRRVLDLPADWEPQGMLLVGYPAKIPEPRARKPAAELTQFIM